MAAKTSEILSALNAHQEEIKAGQERTLVAIQQQGEILRLIAERLGLVLEKLYPEESEGPTLQELLAELVGRTRDNTALLRRIDRRTESMAIHQLGDADRTMTNLDGANGNGANGHGASVVRTDDAGHVGANRNGRDE